MTHHGLNEQLHWTTATLIGQNVKKILKSFFTSNDPLVQTQITVGNCSKLQVTKRGEAFEYLSDFTIRFNTNACIKANTIMLVLQGCANTSSIWGL